MIVNRQKAGSSTFGRFFEPHFSDRWRHVIGDKLGLVSIVPDCNPPGSPDFTFSFLSSAVQLLFYMKLWRTIQSFTSAWFSSGS
jgi:hypothetical protein